MHLPTRGQIRPGLRVKIVEKHNQRSGTLTEVLVARILTKSETHPHGIKVMLQSGQVGQVKTVVGRATNKNLVVSAPRRSVLA